MSVAHQPAAAVVGELVGMVVEQGRNLGFHRLRKQRSRTVAQNFRERIGQCPWLGELENITIGHGVSLLRWRSGRLRTPPRYAALPLMPSPTFANSSRVPPLSAGPRRAMRQQECLLYASDPPSLEKMR